MADEAPKQAPLFADVGSTGLEQWSGYIREEWHKSLTGTKAVKVYKEMRDNEATVGAILYAFEFLIRSASWWMDTKDEEPSPQHIEAKDFAEQCRTDMLSTWPEVLSEILTMLTFGYSLLEKSYKIRGGDGADSQLFRSAYADGRVGWRDLAPRAQETIPRWLFSSSGQLLGAEQRPPPDFNVRKIPIEKCLHFKLKAHKGNPEGRSLLRNAYRSWNFLKRLQEIEAIGIERNVAGFPVITLPTRMLSPGASADERTAVSNYEAMAQKIRADGYTGVVFPAEEEDGKKTGYTLRLMSSSGRSFADTDPIIRRYESRVALSVLGEFVLLGLDKVGSFSLADTKTDLFGVALGAVMDSICDEFNRNALPELMRLNGIPLEYCPVLKHGDVDQPDINGLMTYVVQGVQSGAITPDSKLEQYLRDYGALPGREDAATLLEQATRDAGQLRTELEGEPPLKPTTKRTARRRPRA